MKKKAKRYDEGGGIFDNIKEGLSKAFRRDDESKYSDLESVGGASRRPKTIEEQIKGRPGRENEGKEYVPYRREPEPSKGSTLKPEPSKGSTTYTADEKAIERDVMDVEPKKKAAPEKKAAPTLRAAPTNAAAKQYEPDSKPIKEAPALPPAKMADKKVEPKPLPGKPEPKSKVTPYSAPKKISKEEEVEGERGKRMEEEAAAQLEKNKKETKPSAPVKKGEYYRDFSGKLKKKTPDDRRPLKDLGETVAEGAKSVGEFASKNIKTPAQRRDEEKSVRKNQTQYGMKKGGSVSSASKRADGIAMRGKTRGRIY
jgi:hypothetical protein